MPELQGTSLHGYDIQEKIGEGGYGAIYKAYQSSVGREVAIKVVLPEHASKPEFAQRFDVEARLVAKLEHPHIVPLHDYWRDEDGAFLVMRFLKGGNLRQILQQGAISLSQIARLLNQITDALAIAHQAGVVHRDFKPENILLDERGNAYLTDFGIAKNLDVNTNITETDAIVGTPAYLAPEQIRIEPLSPRTDIYALGIVLYEMLTGRHPFADTPMMMLVVKHLQEPLPSIQLSRPDLPAEINDILQKATAKEPSDRYNEVQTVASEFNKVVNPQIHVPVVAQPLKKQAIPPLLNKPSTPEQRNRASMLQNVRKFWIEGVLENSLHGAALLELGMKQQAGTIDHAWDTLLRMPDAPDQTLPLGTPILEVFDKLNGKLLILGDPGGGKTTTLLELARDLLYRADSDEAHPIPVIFNLSSWSESHKPLVEWLADELSSKYQVPKKVAQQWIASNDLLLLLDGLDEVSVDQREACVQAINTYREEHGFVDVVVCSRIADYEALTNRLKLNGAIVIQPLDDTQVDRYLASFGAEMVTVRHMLTGDASLRELARSPLMLSIMALAYRGVSNADLPKLETPEAQREHIFEVYVRRMFERRIGEKAYSQEQTVHYLSWLAQKMQEHTQSVFQIEKMQPTWLTAEQWKRYYQRVRFTHIALFVILTIVTQTVAATLLGLSPLLLSSLMAFASGTWAWVFTGDLWQKRGSHFFVGMTFGAAYGISIGSRYGIVSGLVVALGYMFIITFESIANSLRFRKMGSNTNHIVVIEKLQFSWQKVNFGVLLVGILPAMIVMLMARLIVGETSATPSQIIVGVFGANILSTLFSGFNSGLVTSELTHRTRPNEGLRQTFIFATLLALTSALSISTNTFVSFAVITSIQLGLGFALSVFTLNGYNSWFMLGGYSVLQHVSMRQVLYRDRAIPQNYARFLDYAASLIFLRKVGGGYIFVHRYLLEYFAHQEKSPQQDSM